MKFAFYYYFKLDEYCKASLNKGNFASVDMSKFCEFRFPPPPLEVQREVVHILDSFSLLIAELTARKKQYEYYRNVLLTFAECGESILDRQNIIKLIQYVFGYVCVKLDDIATITRGGNFQKKDFTEKGVPCTHYGQIYTRYGIYADKTL